MASPEHGGAHLDQLLLIYRPRKDERLSWPSWLTLQRMVYPHKWSPISYMSSVGQGKFAGQRPAFYLCATQPNVYQLRFIWCCRLKRSMMSLQHMRNKRRYVTSSFNPSSPTVEPAVTSPWLAPLPATARERRNNLDVPFHANGVFTHDRLSNNFFSTRHWRYRPITRVSMRHCLYCTRPTIYDQSCDIRSANSRRLCMHAVTGCLYRLHAVGGARFDDSNRNYRL